MRSRMKAASSIARSTKNCFAILGLSGSMSRSFLADKIVAANKMAYFRSSVMGTPASKFAVEEGNRVYYKSVVRNLAMADIGRFVGAGAMIHGLLRPVAVAVVLMGIPNFVLTR